jgi:hypothetical protein
MLQAEHVQTGDKARVLAWEPPSFSIPSAADALR